MNLKINYPKDFPLHGLDRDVFGTKLRDALRLCFYGKTIRQLADRVGARRARAVPDALPLRQIASEQALEDCIILDGCRIDDMSSRVRPNLLRDAGMRIGSTIPGWADSSLPLLDEPTDHAAGNTTVSDATNRQSAGPPPSHEHLAQRTLRVLLAAGLCAVATGSIAWKLTRPAAPLSATVVSTSPTRTLRNLGSNVPDDRGPYRVSMQIEPLIAGITPR